MIKGNSILEVSTNNFMHNVKEIRNIVGDNIEIMPVIKANAYGTYLNKKIELMNKFKIVAVALVKEACELRELGYENDIFVLNQPFIEEIDDILKYDITVGVSSKEFVLELGKYNKGVKIHIELETGMGRTGVNLNELETFIDKIKEFRNIKIEGIYTHFSSADCDFDYTNYQIELFEKGVAIVKEKVQDIKYIHSSASNGILNFETGICNMVRPGIILYGYESCKNPLKEIDLKPVAKLKAKISFIKIVEKGTSISYGRTFIAKRRMKIATVTIGYADGIRRCLSNKGQVVINGKKASIIGKVCMDSFMIDVSEFEEVKIGDEVYIWDNDIITLDDLAKNCDTINYEIISTISDRVYRKFID